MNKCPKCGSMPITKVVELYTKPNSVTEYYFLFGCEKCRLYLPETFKIRLTLNKMGRIEILEQDRLDVITEKWSDFVETYDDLRKIFLQVK